MQNTFELKYQNEEPITCILCGEEIDVILRMAVTQGGAERGENSVLELSMNTSVQGVFVYHSCDLKDIQAKAEQEESQEKMIQALREKLSNVESQEQSDEGDIS